MIRQVDQRGFRCCTTKCLNKRLVVKFWYGRVNGQGEVHEGSKRWKEGKDFILQDNVDRLALGYGYGGMVNTHSQNMNPEQTLKLYS